MQLLHVLMVAVVTSAPLGFKTPRNVHQCVCLDRDVGYTGIYTRQSSSAT